MTPIIIWAWLKGFFSLKVVEVVLLTWGIIKILFFACAWFFDDEETEEKIN